MWAVIRTRFRPCAPAFEDIANAKSRPTCFTSTACTLVGEGRVTGDDESQRMRDRAVMISSITLVRVGSSGRISSENHVYLGT